MRAWTVIIIVFGLGFFTATFLGKSERKLIRSDEITLKRTELNQLIRGIEVVRDKQSDGELVRFEADSGSFGIECPTTDACNLFTHARRQAVAPVIKAGSLARASSDSVTESRSAPERKPHLMDKESERGDNLSFDESFDDDEYQIMAKFGLEEGDSIISINEEEMATPDEAAARLEDMVSKNAAVQSLTVIRRGERVTLSYAK